MLEVLDVIFHSVHISLITISLTFWMSFRTLKWAQVVLFFTVVSWFGLGYFYGFGYCFLTQWHWQIKENLGESNLPASYLKYIFDRLTGMDWNPVLVDQMAFGGLIFAVVGCVYQTVRKRKAIHS